MDKKKITIEELLKAPYDGHFVADPNGNKIVFMSLRTGKNELFLFDMESKEINQLTNNTVPISATYAPVWSRDGKYFIFISDKFGNEKFNFFKFEIKTKEINQITKLSEHADLMGQFNFSNKQMAFFSDREGDGKTQIYTCDLNGENIKKRTNFQGMMFSRRITFPWSNLKYSSDDSIIYFTGNSTTIQSNFSIFQVDLNTNETKLLLSINDESKEILADSSSRLHLLLFQSDETGVNRAGIINTKSKEILWLGDSSMDETPLFFTNNDKNVVVVRDEDAEKKIIIYNVEDGKGKILEFPLGVNSSILIPNSENIIVIHSNSVTKASLNLYNLNTSKKTLLYQPENGGFLPERDFHPDEYVSYSSTQDATIYAILYKPKHLEKNKKYPAIIDVHGGPSFHYTRNFYPITQVIVDSGFIILKPNFRGSTGYGRDFKNANLNDQGGKDLDDIEAGVNYLKTLDYVDSNRIGVKGGSYGGYITYLALTKRPKLFKAGSAIVGVTDLLLQYETVKKLFPWMAQLKEAEMGIPDNEETINLWKDRSPINFAHQLESNLLIIHTKNDPRVPVNQAENFRNKLIEFNKEHLIEYHIHENQGHGISNTDEIINDVNLEIDFFLRNL